MRLDASVIEKARAVQGEKTPARLYNSIEYELGSGAVDNEDDYDRGEEALGILEARFPGIQRQARQVTDPPAVSRKAGTRLLEEDHSALKAGPKREHDIRRRRGGARARAASATAIHARPRARVGGWGARRFQQTGIPGAYQSTAELVMRTIGAIAGLSLFYMLVAKPRGVQAIQTASDAGVKTLKAFISPSVDPLRPGSGSQSALAKLNASTMTPMSTQTGPAASVSGTATPRRPSMLSDPFSGFPKVNTNLTGTALKRKLAPGVTTK